MMMPFAQIQPGKPIGAPQQPGNLLPLPSMTGDGTFEALLGLFGMGEPAKQTAAVPFDLTDPKASSTPADITSAITQAVSNMLQTMPALPTDTSANDRLEWPKTGAKEDDFSALFAAKPGLAKETSNRLAMPIAQPWAMTKLLQQVELQPGNYQVLKAQAQDGTLNLEVASKDKLAEPIKISVPLDMLKNEQPSGPVKPTRPDFRIPLAPKPVSIQSDQTANADLDALLNSVNLRELQVAKAPASPFVAASEEPVALRLIGEQAGQRVVLAAKLEKTDLKATSARKSSLGIVLPNQKMPSGPASQVAVAEPSLDDYGLPVRRIRSGAVALDTEAKPEDFQSIEKLLGGAAEQSGDAGKFETLLGASKDTQGTHAALPKSDTPAVKVSLPLEPLPMKPEGKTIMLRIEPEHLGPARLQLTMRHESLTAKVTVETPQAKAAVEASLDQLTDQLGRAGVKVDYIQVDVRNGGADSQQFHRPTEWFRSSRQSIARFVDETSLDITPRAIPLVRPAYVGTSGVNLYA